jgi:uncharacterized repeat protein (TIGR03803 family)
MSRNRKRLSTLEAVMLVVIIVIPVLTPGAWAQSKYKTLYKFSGGKDGKFPQAGLIFDQAGNLYSTTLRGGAHGGGTVFKLTPNADGSWRESVLYSFCSRTNCGDGENPIAGLTLDTTGNLYGTTIFGGANGGGGTVFKLAPNADGSWRESVLYSFCLNCSDASGPFAGLIFDQAGNLYGTTSGGGALNQGAVFKLAPNADGSWRESVLYSFCSLTNCADGRGPQASLIFDQAGNLYSTTLSGGGPHNLGTVFKLTPNADGSWRESVLHSFCSRTNCGDGELPYVASLIFDQAGNLYGTTSEGGDLSCNNPGYGCGVVFKLVPNSNGGWKETVLHTFFDHPGVYPLTGVIFDPAGNLYGTTLGDGRENRGTFGSVFEITP